MAGGWGLGAGLETEAFCCRELSGRQPMPLASRETWVLSAHPCARSTPSRCAADGCDSSLRQGSQFSATIGRCFVAGRQRSCPENQGVTRPAGDKTAPSSVSNRRFGGARVVFTTAQRSRSVRSARGPGDRTAEVSCQGAKGAQSSATCDERISTCIELSKERIGAGSRVE